MTAGQSEANSVKVFPIEVVDGVKYIKSLQVPLGSVNIKSGTREMLRYCWLLLLLLALTACGNQLSKENFSKVTQNMTPEEVKGILGEPKEVDSGTLPLLGTVTTWIYKTDRSKGTIIFHDGKATVISYEEGDQVKTN